MPSCKHTVIPGPVHIDLWALLFPLLETVLPAGARIIGNNLLHGSLVGGLREVPLDLCLGQDWYVGFPHF
jgi:hypothetical protein